MTSIDADLATAARVTDKKVKLMVANVTGKPTPARPNCSVERLRLAYGGVAAVPTDGRPQPEIARRAVRARSYSR